MKDEQDGNSLRGRYAMCRFGLVIASFAPGMMAFEAAGYTAYFLTWSHELRSFLNSPERMIIGSTTIAWSMLLSSWLLSRCWTDSFWRRGTLPLVLLGLVAMGIWVFRHAALLGLSNEVRPFPMEFMNITNGLRWVWAAILTVMTAEVAHHLGLGDAQKYRAALLALIASAVAVWIVVLLFGIQGVFLPRGAVNPRFLFTIWMHELMSWVLRLGAYFGLTCFLLLTARECRRLEHELKRSDDQAGFSF